MTDRILALIALVVLACFLAILAFKVSRWDLGGVIAITLALAAWDFVSSAVKRSPESKQPRS